MYPMLTHRSMSYSSSETLLPANQYQNQVELLNLYGNPRIKHTLGSNDM